MKQMENAESIVAQGKARFQELLKEYDKHLNIEFKLAGAAGRLAWEMYQQGARRQDPSWRPLGVDCRTKDFQNLSHGLYRIYWKTGGCSLASVGSLENGKRWYAPSNWISGPSTNWDAVESVEPIEVQFVQHSAGYEAQQQAKEQSAEEQDPIKLAVESLRRALAFLERPAEVFDALQKENKKLKGIINFVDGAVSCAEGDGEDQALVETIRVKIPAKKNQT